jgi:hypothetical protein
MISGQSNQHKLQLPKQMIGKAFEFENQITDCCENISKSNRPLEPRYIAIYWPQNPLISWQNPALFKRSLQL